MGRKEGSGKKPVRGDAPKLNTPFEQLSSLRDRLPPGMQKEAEEDASPDRALGEAGSVPVAPRRAVVRFERKGRGGKEATLVEKLDLSAGELSLWARELKAALGVGGNVEGEAIMLQGDCRDRVATLLRKRGVKDIRVS